MDPIAVAASSYLQQQDLWFSLNEELVEIPEDCICPISQEVMQDPVVAADGMSYERAHIQALS